MNIHKAVWDNTVPIADRLNELSKRRTDITDKITNRKKLVFDIYYDFSPDSYELTFNNEWKQLTLAIEVAKVVRRWNRFYQIDLKKKMSGKYFIDYFKGAIDISPYNLCTLGINFYGKESYTLKTMILWANKLCKKGIITDVKFNSFMEELEALTNGMHD